MNFASLAQPGGSFAGQGTSVTQQGFTFGGGAFYTWQESSPNLPGLSAADTSLFQFFSGLTTTVTDAGNAPFTLNSIGLAPLIAGGSGSFDVTFTGTFADLSTVSQTFSVNDGTPTALQTFDFSGFTNVVSVSFVQGSNAGFFVAQDTAYQFDDLTMNNPTISGSPEPSTVGLLAFAGSALAVVRFRRNRRAL